MLLDARPIREKKLEELKMRVEKLEKKPGLVIIRVGNDPASEKYVNNKVKMCEHVGINSKVLHYKEDVTNMELFQCIKKLNSDKDVTGILIQLPLPKHLDEDYLLNIIDPKKEVDGFCVENMGRLVRGEKAPVACTPKGIITLLKEYNIPIEGKDVLIINRSNIVGKPLAHLFSKENATVTLAHSKTKNLKQKIKMADIIVTGVGKPNFLGFEDISAFTTVVDVSINFNEDGKMCGDVRKADYEYLSQLDCNITPVPNGVGIMTVLSLIEQTIEMEEDKQK